MNTGALGHGLPICIGMALAARMDAAPWRPVFTLLGDGELAEGSNAGRRPYRRPLRITNWSNLTAIIDSQHPPDHRPHPRRHEQRQPLDEKWRAFGWAVRTINGHDYAALTEVLSQPAEPGKPTCVIRQHREGQGSQRHGKCRQMASWRAQPTPELKPERLRNWTRY